MESRFQCIVHHRGEFVEFTKLGYKGLEETWDVDPNILSYFEVLSGLKDLGYPSINSLWYCDQMEFNSMVLLKDDNGTRRIKIIAVLTGPNVVEEGTADIELGKNNVERTIEVENVVDERDILDKGTTQAEIVVDGTTEAEIVMDATVDEGLNCNMEEDEGLGEFDYEVRHISYNGEKYIVSLSTKESYCRGWTLIGFPCFHAISCMKAQQVEIENFMPNFNKRECYKEMCAPIIYPVNGETPWEKIEYVDLQPPPIKRKLGMPKKEMTRDALENIRDETQLKRANFRIKCSMFPHDGEQQSYLHTACTKSDNSA
ncbi:hypothetical protein KIW84_012026 [Lathyrus oleraceus]|uniref:PB1-like domain-containing protein n=1 Tax=Pisum sativum TaxID=3888 RepID=A0A9D5GVJ8_PEA|nr:hypothetical protein KIW84_012026 [Pisum sativum]